MSNYTRKTHDHFTVVLNGYPVATADNYVTAWDVYRGFCKDPEADVKLYRSRGIGLGSMIEHRPRVNTEEVSMSKHTKIEWASIPIEAYEQLKEQWITGDHEVVSVTYQGTVFYRDIDGVYTIGKNLQHIPCVVVTH